MLDPNVLEIIDDPEVGGGVSFTVFRKTMTRTRGSVAVEETQIFATGNIQPENKSASLTEAEDLLEERITIYTTCILTIGGKMNGQTFAADELVYNGKRYRVTTVDNYSDWGFVVGHATRMRE